LLPTFQWEITSPVPRSRLGRGLASTWYPAAAQGLDQVDAGDEPALENGDRRLLARERICLSRDDSGEIHRPGAVLVERQLLGQLRGLRGARLNLGCCARMREAAS